MKYIKNHKLTVFLILVYIIVVICAYALYNMFIGSSGLPVYGDRLDGIEEVEISKEQYTKIKKDIEDTGLAVKVNEPYLSGKTLEVVITVGDSVALKSAKELANKITENLTDDQNDFYDVQVFIKKNYNCNINATGKMNEDGTFTDKVVIEFADDLSKNNAVVEYGLSKSNKVDYNKEQQITIEEDGTYTIYGYTKDKVGENSCNIKIVKKASENNVEEDTVSSLGNTSFPIIGYKKYGTKNYVWTKDR